MIDKPTIFEIHRLKHLGWSERKIARHLRIDRGSVKEYVTIPEVVQKRPYLTSKLDPYRDRIKTLLDEDPTVSAPVVWQQLEGFTGKITIVRDYLRQLRGKRKQRIAYTRFESAPGEQMIQLSDLVGIWKPDTTNDMFISYIKFYDDGAYRIAYEIGKN